MATLTCSNNIYPDLEIAIEKALKQCDTSALKKMVLTTRKYRKAVRFSWLFEGGQNVLHFAAMSGQLQICEKVLCKIKDKSPKDNSNRTPIHLAAYFGHYNVCSLMLKNIIDKNPKDELEITPLHYAAEKGYLEICILMVEEYGIDPNVTLVDKATSLHLAAAYGHFLTFSYLMEKATQKTPQTKYGCTPLHFAAKAGQLEICKLILSNTKEKNPTDYLRETPISIAAKSRHTSLCIYLTCETLKAKLGNIMTATPSFFSTLASV